MYIPHTPDETKAMLEALGISSIEELFERQIPKELLWKGELNLPEKVTEVELLREVEELATSVRPLHQFVSFLGAGGYDSYVPPLVDALTGRGEFFTAYTPYQAEASQGTLQATFEFQTMICQLTAMDVANASLYDGASALAESVLMAARLLPKRKKVLLSEAIHPEYRETVVTYVRNLDLEIVTVPLAEGTTDPQALADLLDEHTLCFAFQSPNCWGCLEAGDEWVKAVNSVGALLISVIADPLSLSLLKPPGEYGAHIVCGEAQSLGNPLSLGGPSLGFLATRNEYLRRIPGRIVGETVDRRGNRAFVLTLQTREQHIRREKATSNICTNQALLALRTAVYLAALGQQGFVELGSLCCGNAHDLAQRLTQIPGFSLAYPQRPFFREFTLNCPVPAAEILDELEKDGFLAGFDAAQWGGSPHHLVIAVTEKHTAKDFDRFVEALSRYGS